MKTLNPRQVIRRMRHNLAGLGNAAKERQVRLVTAALRSESRRLAQAGVGTWTHNEAQATVLQLRLALSRLTVSMAAGLGEDLVKATLTSYQDAKLYLRSADKAYAGAVRPLRFEAANFIDRAVEEAGQARIANYGRSFARYGASLTRAVEEASARAVMLGVSWREAANEVSAALRSEANLRDWEIRRVVETEVSAAYNQLQLDALIAEDYDPADRMHKRLIAVFDRRTGRDSVLLHGQTQPVREPFYDPTRGRSYMAPPNRPHDREMVVGWRESYGDAAVRDAQEDAREAEEERLPLAARPERPPPPRPSSPPVSAPGRRPVPPSRPGRPAPPMVARTASRTSPYRTAPAPASTPRRLSPGLIKRPRAGIPGKATRHARNLRAGDVLSMPGRPRIVQVVEQRGRMAVQVETGLWVYFAAGAIIGVLAGS